LFENNSGISFGFSLHLREGGVKEYFDDKYS
jgi:hypothetical protein